MKKENIPIKLFVLSDVHLEKMVESKQQILLFSINEKCEETRLKGFDPIVLCAGDLNNSNKGYDFLAKIKAKVFYIAGNHEFWGGDYYETIDLLKKTQPKNVTFLHNEIASCDRYIILGATLWTDVGQHLNKNLLVHAGSRMNDMSYITAKKWYSYSENKKRLKKAYEGYTYESDGGSESWNALVEIDENKLSWEYISNVSSVLKSINKCRSVIESINADIFLDNSLFKTNEEILRITKEKISITKKTLSWKEHVNNLFEIHKNYKISEIEKIEYLANSLEKELIFQKVRFIEDIEKKEILVMTHHLPFYEEILVGSMTLDAGNYPIKLYNDNVSEKLFLIRDGEEYPEFNYLYRSSRGEIERQRDITHIVNYYNPGSNKITKFLLENVKTWVHGHEHHFRYQDYVKGIQMVTNPCGSALTLLDGSVDNLRLNSNYAIYHKIKNENIKLEIKKITTNLILEVSERFSRQNLELAAQIWTLKHYNWEDHLKALKKIEKVSKEILLLSVEYILREGNSDHVINKKNIEEKIGIWSDSYNKNCETIKKLHDELITAFSVRVEKDFTFQKHLTGSMITMIDIYSWTMGNANKPESVNEESIGLYNAKKSFEAKGNIRLALKYAEKLQDFLNKNEFKNVQDITEKNIEEFIELSKHNITKELVAKKLIEKWEIFCNKTFNNI
jgi:predicted phosphodiesterase